MDDLEEVWGPRGRATVEPGSIRAVAPARDAAVAPAPTPTAPVPPSWAPAPEPRPSAGAVGAGGGPAVPPSRLVAMVVGALVAIVAVVALVVVTRPSDPPAPAVATGATATTIVSAAADLLGRTRSTAPGEAPPATATSEPSAPNAPMVAPTTAPPTPAPASTAGLPPLVLAEDAARQFIGVLERRDCDGLWSMLSRGTQAFLAGDTEPGEPSGRDALCDGLRSEEAIPPMRVHGRAEWRGAGAAVPLESEGEVEHLTLVAEEGRWVIDLFGGLGQEPSTES